MGQTVRAATFTLDREALAYYDDGAGTWMVEAGEFEVMAGTSSADIYSTASFRLTETARFGGSAPLRVTT